jgi:hypothetical protein
MQDFGGLDVGAPQEDQTGVSEQAGESGERFQAYAAAQAAAQQQIRREEQRAKRQDDGVAAAILQFLTDAQRAHLSVLIAQLVARECPSTFLLAVLSLISDRSREALEAELAQRPVVTTDLATHVQSLVQTQPLDPQFQETFVAWLTRLQVVLHHDAPTVLMALRTEDHQLDGTILQLTAFTLQDAFRARQQELPFDQLQALAGGILQLLFEAYV